MHGAAEIKVEKTELKEVVATVVAGEEVEAIKMATAPPTTPCRSPPNPPLGEVSDLPAEGKTSAGDLTPTTPAEV